MSSQGNLERYTIWIHEAVALMAAEMGDTIHDFSSRSLATVPLDKLRHFLKQQVTTAPHDPSPECTDLIESIILEEQHLVAITNSADLAPHAHASGDTQVCVWRGDITRLRIDAITNAANSALLGCFRPNHPCIDNAIHCAAGPKLRAACRAAVATQGEAPTGQCLVTSGFCLPAAFVLHTVGPIYDGTGADGPDLPMPRLLASCYTSCLDEALESGCRSVAFCCISTGVFGYPQHPACRTALSAVKRWVHDHPSAMERIVFNVFTEIDEQLYLNTVPEVFESEGLELGGAADASM